VILLSYYEDEKNIHAYLKTLVHKVYNAYRDMLGSNRLPLKLKRQIPYAVSLHLTRHTFTAFFIRLAID